MTCNTCTRVSYEDTRCSLCHILEANAKVGRRVFQASHRADRAVAGKQVRIEECANEDSRFPSWLKPSRTINCLPKISAPTPGRQATIPAAPPLPLMYVLVQRHAHIY